MGPIVIIKMGSTYPALVETRRDFEDWIRPGLASGGQAVTVVNVHQGDPLPAADALAGAVITGSHAMVTDREAWSERTAAWLPAIVAQGVPVLGICYGHQLLAHALGGEVRNNPRGREFGTMEVQLNAAAQQHDPLLGGLPTSIHVHTSHTQSVIRLPAGARWLAASAKDPHAAFVVGECAWGVQFHPEFDAAIVRAYIRYNQNALRAEGQDPAALSARSTDTRYGPEILRRFAARCAAR